MITKKFPILFFCRDSKEAKYISSKLAKENLLDCLVIESGEKARKLKFKRYFANKSLFSYPVIILDIFVITLYNKLSEINLDNSIKSSKYPKIKKHYINDINDKKCINLVKKYRDPIIVVFGVGIIKEDFLNTNHKAILNIHTGIVPFYRNVHSEFWAIKNKDYKNVGISIMYVDKGIDTGDIALIQRVNISRKESIFSVKTKLTVKAVESIIKSIEKLKENRLPRKKQTSQSIKNYYKTPTALDLLKFIFGK